MIITVVLVAALAALALLVCRKRGGVTAPLGPVCTCGIPVLVEVRQVITDEHVATLCGTCREVCDSAALERLEAIERPPAQPLQAQGRRRRQEFQEATLLASDAALYIDAGWALNHEREMKMQKWGARPDWRELAADREEQERVQAIWDAMSGAIREAHSTRPTD